MSESETPMFEETLIEVLDFPPQCDEDNCVAAAAWVMRWGCDCAPLLKLMCEDHAAPWLRCYYQVRECLTCHVVGEVRRLRQLEGLSS